MSIELDLIGTARRSAKSPLKTVSAWLHANLGEDADDAIETLDTPDGPVLLARVHPAGEGVEFTSPTRGVLKASVRTASAGPGYHEFVCTMLHAIGEALDVEWREDEDADPTSFFFTQDEAQLASAFDRWLSGVLKSILGALDSGRAAGPVALGLPQGARFVYPAAVLTPMGPRGVEWIRRGVESPVAARDCLPWWLNDSPARVALNTAISTMWTEVTWAEPHTEESHQALGTAIDLLFHAYESDPDLPFPWREWHELNTLGELDDPLVETIAARARGVAASEPLIGYRRGHDVIHSLPGGWTVRLPGHFSTEMENEETWLAADPTTTIRVSSMSMDVDNEEAPSADSLLEDDPEELEDDEHAPPADAEVLEWSRGETRAKGHVYASREEDRRFQVLQGRVACPGNFAMITVCFDKPVDRAMAEAAWRSLTLQPRAAE